MRIDDRVTPRASKRLSDRTFSPKVRTDSRPSSELVVSPQSIAPFIQKGSSWLKPIRRIGVLSASQALIIEPMDQLNHIKILLQQDLDSNLLTNLPPRAKNGKKAHLAKIKPKKAKTS